MTLIVYTVSNYVHKKFIDALIPKGVGVVHIQLLESLTEKIHDLNADIAVIDMNEIETAKIEELLNVHAAIDSGEKMSQIILYGTMDKKTLVKLIQMGIAGFIRNDMDPENIYDYLSKVYTRGVGAPPERKHVRISFDPKIQEQRIIVKFRLPHTSTLVLGVLKDISFGGMAVQIVNNVSNASISKGTMLHNMQFNTGQFEIFSDGEVVLSQGDMIAVKFVYLSKQDGENLSLFISKKLSQ